MSVTLTISPPAIWRYSPVAMPVAEVTVIVASPAATAPSRVVFVAPVFWIRRLAVPVTRLPLVSNTLRAVPPAGSTNSLPVTPLLWYTVVPATAVVAALTVRSKSCPWSTT